jgi:glycosyltransferase involved in cell wall biosynthesis
MPSFLGEYRFGAKDRIPKFHRAINSFLKQNYDNKELIVVSDGCEITSREILNYKDNSQIKHSYISKQELFSGLVREEGLKNATGDIICYLDSDDMLGDNHLLAINTGFVHHEVDWVYFDDSVLYALHGKIGTSSIAHKRQCDINWLGCHGYGHDWTFIKKLIDSGKSRAKIYNTKYFVCHIPNGVDN